jgi:hypothetical protein
MARGQKDKLYRSFNKGLITEAGFLTYPEDASTDELNTVIYRKGNRSRRLGIDFEEDSEGYAADELDSSSTVTEFFWRAPGNDSKTNFVVMQIGQYLYFFDAAISPMVDGVKGFIVDLSSFKSPTATLESIRTTHVSMASGKGYLFVAQEHIDPFTIEYLPDEDSIETVRIYILMRDFDGINDNLPNDAEPSVLSKEHHYNLRNQGWVPPGSPSVQGSVPGGSTEGSTGGVGDSGGVSGIGAGAGSGGDYYNPYTGGVGRFRWEGGTSGMEDN